MKNLVSMLLVLTLGFGLIESANADTRTTVAMNNKNLLDTVKNDCEQRFTECKRWNALPEEFLGHPWWYHPCLDLLMWLALGAATGVLVLAN